MDALTGGHVTVSWEDGKGEQTEVRAQVWGGGHKFEGSDTVWEPVKSIDQTRQKLESQIRRQHSKELRSQALQSRSPSLHETDDELVMIHWVSGQFKTVHAEMDVGGCEGRWSVPIEEWVDLDDTLEECRCLGDGVFVVAGLGAEYGCLQCAKISGTTGAPEFVDHQGVDREDFNISEVVPHLLGQHLV